jgi:predicted TIM-barrel fold metal-dependent hydrolase
LEASEETGLDVQVLSLTAPGVQNLAPDDAVALQTASDDVLAAAVQAHPNRFQGFATLATPRPEAAALEVDRTVKKLGFNGAMHFGRTRDRNLDDRANEPIFEAASGLGAYSEVVSLTAPLVTAPIEPTPSLHRS